MSATTAPAPVPSTVAADPGALRIVLFGMPDAGKSSLLGALVQAAHTQDRILQGRLFDLTNGLAELWRRVYEDRQRETLEEIVPYPVLFDPYPGHGEKSRLNVVLYDCDGRVANELLSQRKALRQGAKPGSLATAILNADALILAIDASASNEQIETDFREFVRFLRTLETHRSHDRAVGGLPVFLALTKCDLLAREGMSRAEWEARIAERTKQVRERFARYLEGNAGPAGSLSKFGSLNLHVVPTAVKRPALADAPVQPREPMGVADLFHDCLRAAQSFRERTASSNRRLQWTLAGVGGFVGLAVTAAVIFFASGPPQQRPTALADRVEEFRARDGPLPDRLANDKLQRRATELIALRDDPQFEQLPADLKQFVRSRLDELQAYLRFREQLAQLPEPERARNLTELEQIREKHATQALVPEPYRKDWGKTQAVLERDHRLKNIEVLRAAVEELRTFFTSLRNRANDRLFDSEFTSRWEEQVNAIFEMEKKPPIPRGEPVTGNAYEFDEVAAAQKEWLSDRLRLEQVRDLGLALGLIGDPASDGAVLAIPAQSADADLNAFAASRLQKLKKLYPSWKAWTLASIPDALQAEVRKKLNRSLDQMLRDGRRMVLAKFRQVRPAGDDTHKDWVQIADWLLSPGLQDWRELLAFLAKLNDPTAEDPAAATAAFLKQPKFEMQFRALTVTVPNNLPQGPFIPGETLSVFVWSKKDARPEKPALTFRIDKKATIDSVRDKKYRYELESADGRLTYDVEREFEAELSLTKGNKVWRLSWSNPRAATFAFDALDREPILSAVGTGDRGMFADGVTVSIDGKFPRVPALVPDVRRERK